MGRNGQQQQKHSFVLLFYPRFREIAGSLEAALTGALEDAPGKASGGRCPLGSTELAIQTLIPRALSPFPGSRKLALRLTVTGLCKRQKKSDLVVSMVSCFAEITRGCCKNTGYVGS